MDEKIRVGAVSYLNTKPLLYGIERSDVRHDMTLSVAYPALLAQQLRNNEIDMALLPVAAIPGINGAHIVGDHGIASDGNVVSVAIFSRVPMEEVTEVYLDYQSRTSVRLAQLLLQHYWKKEVVYRTADEHFIDNIKGTTAGVIIGDRALKMLNDFAYVYDLSAAWKAHTGLDFVFAAWVANKELPQGFIARFDAANAEGLKHIDAVIAENPFPWYDLNVYYRENIQYVLDEPKRKGLDKFLKSLSPTLSEGEGGKLSL
ncbi:menaquinone biosynthesis protein [Nemorincola caseinilytica]|uniref:Chorismate dehydratase n=1 Tax=Nemorincola caseinilytica TaxID=2054315 RepID=A0ABP8N1D4_9BACT